MPTVCYGERCISYDVEYVQRRTMAISVHPDMKVIVKAPLQTSIEAINKKVLKRVRWISKQQDFFAQYHPKEAPRQYIGGEAHLYLGRRYRLRVESTGCGIKVNAGNIIVSAKNSDPEQIKKKLEAWYRSRAADYFSKSVERCWKDFETMGFDKPKIVVKKLEKRWGSFAQSGTLTLNINLIKAPKECIDYVVTHELCHMKYHDHSRAFYDLLFLKMSDWEKRKMKLEKLHCS